MRQLQDAALQIQTLLLILAHAEDLLFRIGDEAGLQTVAAARQRLEQTGFLLQRTAVGDLLQQDFPIRIFEGDLQGTAPLLYVQVRYDLTIPDRCVLIPDLDRDVFYGIHVQQRCTAGLDLP